jgi:hypothetical protein
MPLIETALSTGRWTSAVARGGRRPVRGKLAFKLVGH